MWLGARYLSETAGQVYRDGIAWGLIPMANSLTLVLGKLFFLSYYVFKMLLDKCFMSFSLSLMSA